MIKLKRFIPLIMITLALAGCSFDTGSSNPNNSNNDLEVIDSSNPTISKIEVTKLPNKVKYYKDERFETKGIEVTATYTDGTTSVVNNDDLAFGYVDMSKAGEVVVNVVYNGKICTFNITIIDDAVSYPIINELKSGMKVVIAESSYNTVMNATELGELSTSPMTLTFDKKKITKISNNYSIFYVEGENNNWSFKHENKYLSLKDDVLSLSEEEFIWKTSISSSNYKATISSETQKIFYSNSAKQYISRSGNATSSYVLPYFFLVEEAIPTYADDISFTGVKDNLLYVGDSKNVDVSFYPKTTNVRDLVFESSNPEIATIDEKGNISALKQGKTTIKAIYKKDAKETKEKSFVLDVKNVLVTNIKLSSSSMSMKTTNGYRQLVETISPSNATNKEVIWTSENNNIARVTNGRVYPVNEGTTNIVATTVDGGYTAKCEVTVSEEALDRWTLFVYMCGSDLESGNGLASSDIKEILSVANQPEDFNVVIQTGGSRKWSNSNINANKLQRFEVRNKKLNKVKELDRASMGSSKTLEDFVAWGLENYPAEKTGFIFWNHGGAMSGVCSDENYYGDSLSNREVQVAFRNAFAKAGREEKLEFVAYDACLMAVQDIADYNSEFFNYMVSSQETEIGYGYDYDSWLGNLYADKTTETIITSIADTFITSVNAMLKSYGQTAKDNDQTSSVLDLSKFADYKKEFETLALNMQDVIPNVEKDTFRSMFKNSKSYADMIYTTSELSHYYGITDAETLANYGFIQNSPTTYILPGYVSYGTFDIIDYLGKLKENSDFASLYSQIAKVEDAFHDLVIHNNVGLSAGNSNGLCLFFPLSRNCSAGVCYDESETSFTNWHSIVEEYGEY